MLAGLLVGRPVAQSRGLEEWGWPRRPRPRPLPARGPSRLVRALAALSRVPGRPAKKRNWELDAAQAEIGALTEAIKAQAIELAVIRGKSGWG